MVFSINMYLCHHNSQGISIILSGICSTMDRLENCQTLIKVGIMANAIPSIMGVFWIKAIIRQDVNELNGREECFTVLRELQIVTVINLLVLAVYIAEMLVLLFISIQTNDKKQRYSRLLVLPSRASFVFSSIISLISLLYMFQLSFVAVDCIELF